MSAPEPAETSVVGHFGMLENPRDAQRRGHHLIDMVVIAIAATLGGSDGWVDIAQFGRAKDAWFRRFLNRANGIASQDTFARAVRGHWGVNDLHWGLDVALREDDCRVRETPARENPAVLRPIGMLRLKNDSTKLGIKTKRLKAGWDDAYLEKLLFEAPPTLRPTPSSGAANISRG